MCRPDTFRLGVACIIALATFASGARAADCANPGALGTSRTMVVDPAATPRVGLKHFPTTLPLADNEVVLTFDDGPMPATTNRVLAALAKECVRATFFLIGRNAVANPATVRKIAAEGHTVAHHTFAHPILTTMSLPKALDEIDKGFAAVDKELPDAAKTSFFRFPGFASNQALLDKVAERKIVVFGADLWVSDWNPMTPEQELSQLTQRLAAARRGIILMHDIHASTATMLPSFLKYLKTHGYKVVAIVPKAADKDPSRLPSAQVTASPAQ